MTLSIKHALAHARLPEDLSNDELCRLIEVAEPLREKAARQLLRQSPSNAELIFVIRWVEPLRRVAWQQLIQEKASTEELYQAMEAAQFQTTGI